MVGEKWELKKNPALGPGPACYEASLCVVAHRHCSFTYGLLNDCCQ
jgi:hypothetical protein